jgi:hypothetical protein
VKVHTIASKLKPGDEFAGGALIEATLVDGAMRLVLEDGEVMFRHPRDPVTVYRYAAEGK